MTNGEKADVQKDMLEIRESLDNAMKAAGGQLLKVSELQSMNALYFLSLLSLYNIRFIFTREKKSSYKKSSCSMSHRSKREVTQRRCKQCGLGYVEFKGVRGQCPCKKRHLFLFGKSRKQKG